MSTFERERRYIVIKISDAQAALSTDDFDNLDHIQDRIDAWRKSRGATPMNCLVVESDWPEYEPTWQAIQKRVEGT